MCVYVCAHLLSLVQLFATPWTVAHQAPLFMGILQARIMEWDLPNPGIKPTSLASPARQWIYHLPPGKPNNIQIYFF